jgi:uncharacterized protein YbaR (Trm112 family)/SAM-dependent methyltransferase
MDLNRLQNEVSLLACPETKVSLELCSIDEAERRLQGQLVSRGNLPNGKKHLSKPFARSQWVLLREDLVGAYPISTEGVPILLVPEMLTPSGRRRSVDLCEPQYAEAYEEMEVYNQVAMQWAGDVTNSESYTIIRPALSANSADKYSFPNPKDIWLDAVYDCASQWDAYMHLIPVQGKRVLQLGGMGLHAIKMLLAGAAEAWAITPMLGEAIFARALAEEAGVADQLHCVVSVAEELPLSSAAVDAIYSGGCLHHMQISMALNESARVLKKGGKFAAVDPWRVPFLYTFGTKLLGKREPDVYCRPLTSERIETMFTAFSQARVVHHGSLTRYPILALSKFGIKSSLSVAWSCNMVDDAICSVIPGLRRMGSSVAILGTK